LTSRLKLQRGLRKVSLVSRGAKLSPVLMSSSRSSPSSAPSSAALSAGSEGRCPASDALCRASPRRSLGFDPQPPAGRSPEDRLCPPRRQARRSSPVQSALPSPARSMPLACAMLCLTLSEIFATLRSTSTAPDRLKPFAHRRYVTSAVTRTTALSSWVFTLSDHRRVRSGWRAAPCGVTPVELPRNRTRSARAAQVPPIT